MSNEQIVIVGGGLVQIALAPLSATAETVLDIIGAPKNASGHYAPIFMWPIMGLLIFVMLWAIYIFVLVPVWNNYIKDTTFGAIATVWWSVVTTIWSVIWSIVSPLFTIFKGIL